jgi:hypothetical protein
LAEPESPLKTPEGAAHVSKKVSSAFDSEETAGRARRTLAGEGRVSGREERDGSREEGGRRGKHGVGAEASEVKARRIGRRSEGEWWKRAWEERWMSGRGLYRQELTLEVVRRKERDEGRRGTGFVSQEELEATSAVALR